KLDERAFGRQGDAMWKAPCKTKRLRRCRDNPRIRLSHPFVPRCTEPAAVTVQPLNARIRLQTCLPSYLGRFSGQPVYPIGELPVLGFSRFTLTSKLCLILLFRARFGGLAC